MTDDQHARLLLLRALFQATTNVDKLMHVCAGVSGNRDEAVAAVAHAFDVDTFSAEAILALQVIRFTPSSIEQLRNELAEAERMLDDAQGSSTQPGATDPSGR